jgi:hypothetical protein
MLRLVSFKNYQSPQSVALVVNALRQVFTDVFSQSYTRQLRPVLSKALANQEYKEAAELKLSPNKILHGFSDLLCNKKFFSEQLPYYTNYKNMHEAFNVIFSGPGFADDGAYLLAFYDMDLTVSKDARTHYEMIKDRLSDADKAEVEAYFISLEKSNRALLEVNFLALVDEENKMQGFSIFHVMRFGTDTLMHVRQAAMRQQGCGHASAMAAYFTQHYPYTVYEANQRHANSVIMKNSLFHSSMIDTITAVLDYNPEFYLAWRGKLNMLQLFLRYQQQFHPDRNFFKRIGQSWEMESITPLFSHVRLHKDSFIFQDDLFCRDKPVMLRQKEECADAHTAARLFVRP